MLFGMTRGSRFSVGGFFDRGLAAAVGGWLVVGARWVGARWGGLAVIYLAHGLPYFWVMDDLALAHSLPVAVWGNVLLNALLAPTLLLLAIHLLRRPLLALPYIVAHHLLLLGGYLLFLLYYPYSKVLPNFFLVHQAGNVPFIFQQIVLQLMGYREWLTLALLCASCAVAVGWSRRTARGFRFAAGTRLAAGTLSAADAQSASGLRFALPAPLVAGALGVLVIAAFAAKDVMIQRAVGLGGLQGPPQMMNFKIYGFTSLLARQYDLYRCWNVGPMPWPGKINGGFLSDAAAEGAIPSRQELKNVLIVQFESLDKWVIDHQVDGQYVMPNLRGIKNQSRYFENFFAMHSGGGTSDAEVSALTSLLPQEFMGTGANNLHFLPSLPKALARHGYYSIGMHANNARVYRRGDAYLRLGFDRFLGTGAYSGRNAASTSRDMEFFRQFLPRIMELPEPFFAYMIAISGHGPFRDYSGGAAEFAAGVGGNLGHYLRTHRAIDEAIGFLWGELRRSGLLQRSIVLLYSDHPSFIRDQGCIHRECIPFLIHAEGLATGVDDRLGSHIDVAPTLLAMLGIPEPSQAWLGAPLLGFYDAEGSYDADGARLAAGSSNEQRARKVLFRDGIAIVRDPSGGGGGRLMLKEDEADWKYIQYSDFVFGGFDRPLLDGEAARGAGGNAECR